jgi:hypothetical protein
MKLAMAGDTMLGRQCATRLRHEPAEPMFAEEVVAAAHEADPFVLNLEGTVALTDRVPVVACPGDSPSPSCVRFVRRGLRGRAYWYGVAPFHHFVFLGMLDGIAADAERLAGVQEPAP